MQVVCSAPIRECTSLQKNYLHNTRIKPNPVPFEDLHSILSRLELCDDCSQNTTVGESGETSPGINVDDLFKPDNEGDNFLMTAVIHQREDIANAIIDKVPHYQYMDFQNKMSQTVLHLAVILNMVNLIRRLVAWGAELVSFDHNGNTPLHLACRNGNMNAVVALTTPLSPHEISTRPYYVPFRRIPQSMEVRNYNGNTCLHVAALHGHYPIADYLIRKNYADINAADRTSGDTLLHFAIQSHDMDLLLFLLKFRSLDVNAKRYDGLRPIDLARGLKQAHIQELLIRAGAESSHLPNSVDTCEMYTQYDDITINGVPIS